MLDGVDLLANGGLLDLSGADPSAATLDLVLDVRSKVDGSGNPIWTEPISTELQLLVQPTLVG